MARLGAMPMADRAPELEGADNRVAIERRRFDRAASDYNARVESFPGWLWARVFGLPMRVPLSHEEGGP